MSADSPPITDPGAGPRYLSTSRVLQHLPGLGALLDGQVVPTGLFGLGWGSRSSGATSAGTRAVLAWGRKPSAQRAETLAARLHLPVLRLEDGFLRSFGTGDRFPPLSLVMDDEGIYYDSTRPSALESLLNAPTDVLAGLGGDVARARALILQHQLSKYNHAPALPADALHEDDVQRVLVVDQTRGDLSVSLGGANEASFRAMLAAARTENPNATIYVKTHPETAAGRKGGYLTTEQDGVSANGQRTVVLRGLLNPVELAGRMNRVYVVSSTLGFEALLAGCSVSCFGLPWYAGWGATDDRQVCTRRTRRRSVDELFAAAYFHYTRYLDPHTHQRGSIFDVIEWLMRQRRHDDGRRICVGFPRWRAHNLAPLLSLHADRVHFARDASAARALAPRPGDALVCWSAEPPPGVAGLAAERGARLLRVEDGFVRGVGLGSDLIRPRSLVFDTQGLYFDPSRPSDLEQLLNEAVFTPDELARARRVRDTIVAHGITKYNVEPRKTAAWPGATGRPVVLVPGQVEDDASIRLGCTRVNTNLGLLQAARQAHPDAFIVYKPHPDVVSGNRQGRLALAAASHWADQMETRLSVVSCIEACDELHTLTSLAGFDALLRGKRVVVHGQPFYAGWGLTEDVGGPMPRRGRALTLDQLVAGALLRYPLYWDWALRGETTCEALLAAIVRERTALEANGGLERLRTGWVRRQSRKWGVVLRACLPHAP